MNKKKIYVVFVIAQVLIFSGCNNSFSSNVSNSKTTINEVDTTDNVEATEAETTSDVTTGMDTSTYTITTEKILETEGRLKRGLEYPQLMGKDDTYDEINKIIKNMVDTINSTDIEIPEGEERSYTGTYKVIYHNEDIISIRFKSLYFGIGMAYPINSLYGLTIDLNNMIVVTIDNYFSDVQSILNRIDTDDYTVVEGGMMIFTEEEIKDNICKLFEDNKMDVYTDNFYVDEDSIYIIDNSMGHALGDYSIIEFSLKDILAGVN